MLKLFSHRIQQQNTEHLIINQPVEKLRDAHPVVADILAYRELSKLLSTYINAIPSSIPLGPPASA